MSDGAMIAPFESGAYSTIPAWAFEVSGLSLKERMTLVSLISFDWPDKDRRRKGFVTVSQRELAKKLGVHRTTIADCIRVLEALGLIALEGQGARRSARTFIRYGAMPKLAAMPDHRAASDWPDRAATPGPHVPTLNKQANKTAKEDFRSRGHVDCEGKLQADDASVSQLAESPPSAAMNAKEAQTKVWPDVVTRFPRIDSPDALNAALLDFDGVTLLYDSDEAWNALVQDPEQLSHNVALLRSRHRQGKTIEDPIAWLRHPKARAYKFGRSDKAAWSAIAADDVAKYPFPF